MKTRAAATKRETAGEKKNACGAKGLEKARSYLGSYLPFSTANTQMVVWFIPPIRRRRADLVGFLLRRMRITSGDLPLQKTVFCLPTLWSRLLMHGSAVRGLRLIDTSRRDARDLSCLHGRDGASRKVRASANEVKDGGGYGHPLTHEPVFQRDKRIIERSVPTHLNVSFVSVCAVCCVAPARPKPGRSRQIASQPAAPAI